MQILTPNLYKAALMMCSLFFISSCATREFDFEIEYPRGLKVTKDSTMVFYVKIKNNSNNPLVFSDVKTSCQCIILSKQQLTIKPKSLDSIKIKLMGTTLGEGVESLIFTNNELKKFKNYRIEYDVTD